MNCPLNRNFNISNATRKGNARAFAMNQEEVAKTMIGILSVLNKSALVLFDSGASHSFIAKRFYEKANVKCDEETEPLRISIPSGKSMKADHLAKGVKLALEERTLEADLFILEMKYFDVILGMD
ncbi:hypothetical protein C2S51_014274 [Perilla frutescens var. frutescens]|nr:hypothetical protein C2S51_014274 [Perilla frutescens var. frutescens]